ncbi:chromosomal organization and DNA repair protein [Phlyctema vagabunda]|uniref:Chromosomal organization and DNA repair protein n=1 Tax=Phlyctema vagabunda TaxID=108571 RepID=A0ABR4PEU3_9HELO
MSSRRGLLSRGRRDGSTVSSPATRRPRESEAPTSRNGATPLPDYQAPSCPLNAKAKRDLEELYSNRSTEKYKKHLQAAKQSVTASAVEPNDRLHERQERLKQYAEKRRQPGRENEDKTDAEMEEQEYTEDLEKKVEALTTKAEKALRELIDYSDELAAQDDVIRRVNQQIPMYDPQASAEARRRRRARANGSDAEDDEDAEESSAEDTQVLSAVEILKQLQEEHSTTYSEKTMREKYATNNDYVGFKRAVHDAQHPGPDAPPVPRAGTWFPGEIDSNVLSNPGASQRRRLANRTDNTQNEDDSEDEDEDMIIAGITTSLKCPLTLKLMVEPYSSNKCPHSFEKGPIVEYVRKEAVVYNPDPRRRAPMTGPKTVKCPQAGCEAMLGLNDFHADPLLKRQCQRAAKAEAAEFDEDNDEDDGDDLRPRGTQQNAEEVDDDAEDVVDKDEARKQTLLRVKRERLSSRGPSMTLSRQGRAPDDSSSEPDEDEIDEI